MKQQQQQQNRISVPIISESLEVNEYSSLKIDFVLFCFICLLVFFHTVVETIWDGWITAVFAQLNAVKLIKVFECVKCIHWHQIPQQHFCARMQQRNISMCLLFMWTIYTNKWNQLPEIARETKQKTKLFEQNKKQKSVIYH